MPLALISGVADRDPFGNDDKSTSFAEAEGFVSRALSRQIARDEHCASVYVVVFGDGDTVATHDTSVFFELLETDLLLESFEAEVLTHSDAPEDIRAFLGTCIYCPKAQTLEALLANIARKSTLASVEEKIWTQVVASADARRYRAYLDRCTLCAHRTEAEEALEQLAAADAARDAEAALFEKLNGSGDLAGLKAYTASCIACEFKGAATDQISGIETDTAYKAEQAQLAAVLKERSRTEMAAYLNTCTFCEGKDEVQSIFDSLETRDELAAPCFALASVPQLGGPRLLSEIDQTEAAAACDRALAAFPDDTELTVLRGRVHHAAGDFAKAQTAYQQGVDAGLPMAFGLAGFLQFEPPAGADISQDFDSAETLAMTGAQKGDWLSKQLLSVLYSQGLISGKSAADALPLAQQAAQEGDPVSQFFMGYFNLTGAGLDGATDPTAAEIWFAKSSAQGYLAANTFLAETLEARVENDPDAADRIATLLLDAVAGGDTTALTRLTTGLRDRKRGVVRSVQTRLAELDLYNGGIDGASGAATLRAVEAFAANARNDAVN